jgi:hypothetical protein
LPNLTNTDPTDHCNRALIITPHPEETGLKSSPLPNNGVRCVAHPKYGTKISSPEELGHTVQNTCKRMIAAPVACPLPLPAGTPT